MSSASVRRCVLAVLLMGAASPAYAQRRSESPAGASAREPAVLDRVVAVVRPGARDRLDGAREAVITLSDLRFEAAVALLQSGAVAAALAPLEATGLASALDFAISQRLHVQEADRLRAFSTEPRELASALATLENRMGGERALERFLAVHDRTAADLAKVVERGLRAGRVLDSKVRLRAQVSEADVRSAYDSDTAQHAWPYEERRGLIREMLFRQRYQTLARAETQTLRDRADVRVLWTPDGAEGRAAP